MRRIGFVLSPGFHVMSFAALSVFECANNEMGEPVYDVRLLSETGGLMRSSIGVRDALTLRAPSVQYRCRTTDAARRSGSWLRERRF
jgi:transcriptional regulator GlxA family with amidase domain